MRKLKIGIFVDNYYPMVDGVTIVVDNYARKLSAIADVVVVAPSYGARKDTRKTFPYRVIRVNSVRLPLLKYHLATPEFDVRVRNKLKAEKFDIIHIHSPFSLGLLGIKLAKESDIPVVGTMHSQFKKEFKRYIRSESVADRLTLKLIRAFEECDECWAVNSGMAEVFKGYGYTGEPKVMRNATELKPVQDKRKAAELVNEKYGLSPNDTVLLFVGRINLLKNIMFICNVLDVLKRNGFGFRMMFVGDGPDMTKLKQRVEDLGLTQSVIFCGEVKNRELLGSLYSRSSLFVFPSLFDASSLVQIEAASQGTPTCFLEGAVTAGDVKNNVNGFIGPNDPVGFAEMIISIFNDKNLLDSVSENVKSDIYVTYDQVVNDIYSGYLTLLKGRGKCL